MENITKQDRITLKNLKVADFASEETMSQNANYLISSSIASDCSRQIIWTPSPANWSRVPVRQTN